MMNPKRPRIRRLVRAVTFASLGLLAGICLRQPHTPAFRMHTSAAALGEAEKVDVTRSLFVAKPLDGGSGYTWTLASRLGHMIAEAERQYGPRDPSYTIVGVEFEETGPRIWYPGDRRHVVVQLGTSCLDHPDRAMYQLAHEALHLLFPTGGSNANNLEEGLATHFQLAYMKEHLEQDWDDPANFEPGDPDTKNRDGYTLALAATRKLLKLKPEVIRELRRKQPTLSKVTAADIRAACLGCPHDLADFLAEKFD